MSSGNGFPSWPWWRQRVALTRGPIRRAHRNFRGLPERPIRTVMDIGAHQGEFTAHALDYFEPERVWMVEAIPDLADALKTRWAADTRCRVLPVAVTDRSGEVTFRINRHLASSSLLPVDAGAARHFAKDLSEEKTVTVPGVSLDDLFAQESIAAVDLMKVDIQGAERLLIQGGQDALRRVSVLSMEVLFEPLYQGCALFGELHELLRPLGFHLHGFHGWRRGPEGFLLYADAVFGRV